MRKSVAAVAVGLLLVAGQAAAAGSSTTVRVGDRIGARANSSSEFAGIPIAVLLIGGAVLLTTISVATDDEAESA